MGVGWAGGSVVGGWVWYEWQVLLCVTQVG